MLEQRLNYIYQNSIEEEYEIKAGGYKHSPAIDYADGMGKFKNKKFEKFIV